MMVLRVYRITNTVFVKSKLRKNDLIIVVFYGNLTGVRKERGERMKKLEIVRILAAAILIGGVISIPLINNHTAYKVEKALCEIPLPEETELIESLSQAGKLTGNGNGMQYFGAILIRSELSLEKLETYYSDYRSNEWEYLVEIQEGQSIEVIEHKALQFSEEIEDGGYYIVYSWGSGNSLLKELDMRGHQNNGGQVYNETKNISNTSDN